jgi:hypothetical protein
MRKPGVFAKVDAGGFRAHNQRRNDAPAFRITRFELKYTISEQFRIPGWKSRQQLA